MLCKTLENSLNKHLFYKTLKNNFYELFSKLFTKIVIKQGYGLLGEYHLVIFNYLKK